MDIMDIKVTPRVLTIGPLQGIFLCVYYFITMVMAGYIPVKNITDPTLLPTVGNTITTSTLTALSVSSLFYIRRVYKTMFNTPVEHDSVAKTASFLYFFFRPFFAAFAAFIFMLAIQVYLNAKTSEYIFSKGVLYEAIIIGVITGISVGQSVQSMITLAGLGVKKMKVFQDEK